MKKLLRGYLAALLMIFVMNQVSVVADASNNQYPEICPENVTSGYGYEYLGTLENGELYQDFYDVWNNLMWDFYCSDEEITMKEEIEEDWYQYIGIKEDMTTYFSEEELEIIRNDWVLFLEVFYNDMPIYYFMRNGMFLTEDNFFVVYIPQFIYENDAETKIEDFVSLENRQKYRALIETKLHEYYDLTRDLSTDLEKEQAIYGKLISEVDYYYENMNGLQSHTIIGPFLGTKTVCEGYAQAFELACNYCGLDCMVVEGYAGEAHAWNLVKLDGEWYNADATWDDLQGIQDDEQYYYSAAMRIADEAYTQMYFNMPNNYFSLTHEMYENPMYPVPSDSDEYWGVFIMNEPAEENMGGTITKEQMEEACKYLCEQIEAGRTRIDLYAWDSWITDESWDGVGFPDMIEKTLQEFVSSKGEKYCLPYGYSWTATVLGNIDGNALSRVTVLVSQKIDYSEAIEYYKYNVAGTGDGILLTKYSMEKERTVLPQKINQEVLRALWLTVASKQLVIPEGVIILGLSADRTGVTDHAMEQVVIPGSVRDIYSIGSPNLKAIFIPSTVKMMAGNCISYFDYNKQEQIPIGKIFGYAGSVAEAYAEEYGIAFYDVTGRVLLDNIVIENFTLPEVGTAISSSMDASAYSTDAYDVTKMVLVTEDTTIVANKEYTVQIHITKKGNYGITPATLVDVNGIPASIENIDVDKAIITFKLTTGRKPNASEAQIKAFVERMYTVALGRAAEAEGLEFYTTRLLSGDSNGACLAESFLCSPEFLNKGHSDAEYVKVLYRTFFDREPAAEEVNYWVDKLSSGESKAFVLSGFVNSYEFDNLCADYGISRGFMREDGKPLNPGIGRFAERLYTVVLERAGEKEGIEYWSLNIANGACTPKDAAKNFFLSPEYLNKNTSDAQYITTLYRTFMDREPEAGGVEYWQNVLNNGATREQILEGFADSAEFKGIMANFGL